MLAITQKVFAKVLLHFVGPVVAPREDWTLVWKGDLVGIRCGGKRFLRFSYRKAVRLRPTVVVFAFGLLFCFAGGARRICVLMSTRHRWVGCASSPVVDRDGLVAGVVVQCYSSCVPAHTELLAEKCGVALHVSHL